MTEGEILQKLTAIVRDVFDFPSLIVSPSTTASDVPEWDSLNHITLVVEVERQFGIKFQTAEVEELKNVGELISLVKDKLEHR